MFNSSRPSKEECEKQKRALEEMHNAHLRQQQAKQGPGDQQAATPIDQVIADWQKTLTASAGDAVSSAVGGVSGSPAPSPLFGPSEGKKKDDAKKGPHIKKKEDGDLLICLSVPSDDCSGKTPEEEHQLQEGKLIILDDYDNGKHKKKTHSRHNSAAPAPADSAEAASDLTGLLLPPLRSSSSTPSSATATPISPTASATPPAASAPAGGVASPASSSQPQQQQQQQQGGPYAQPAQFIPQGYGGGQGGYGPGAGSGPAPGSFHPPAYQNVGPGGAPYGTPIYGGAPAPSYAGYPPPQQQQQQPGGYGYPGPAQGYPMYPQQQQQQQPGPMGYAPQAPLQQQMNAPMGYNQARPLGLSAPYQQGGGPMGMASPLPASAPEALADQLSNLHMARQNYMQQQPPPQHAGLMQPLVPVAAPMISSPENSASGGPAGGGDGSGVDDEWHIDYNELETNKEIARGSFGVVYQGAFRGTEVAVKKLIQQHFSPEQMKDFLDEINMMKKLHHPNVVLLIGVCVKEPNLCIVTELLAGSMWNLLHDKSVRLDWKLQHKLLLDTAKGMNYLHLFKPPIIHRDLKSPNLLVDSHFNVKIADFGLARIKAQLMTGNLGTCQYMAPEVITSATYSEKADVYSYGVVIWEVLTRQAPWQGMQPMQIAYGVVHQSMRPPIPPGTAPPLVHLMQQCWHQDPTQRPSFTDILKQLKALHV